MHLLPYDHYVYSVATWAQALSGSGGHPPGWTVKKMTTGHQSLWAPEATADIAADEDSALRSYVRRCGSGSESSSGSRCEAPPANTSLAARLALHRRAGAALSLEYAEAAAAAAAEAAARTVPAHSGMHDDGPGDLSFWGTEGTIVSMTNGYGFIRPAAGRMNGHDLFFHATECKGRYKGMRVKDQVTYSVAFNYWNKKAFAADIKCKPLPDCGLRFHVGDQPGQPLMIDLPRHLWYESPPAEQPPPPPPPGPRQSSIPHCPPPTRECPSMACADVPPPSPAAVCAVSRHRFEHGLPPLPPPSASMIARM